jgi:hypothetical protein
MTERFESIAKLDAKRRTFLDFADRLRACASRGCSCDEVAELLNEVEAYAGRSTPRASCTHIQEVLRDPHCPPYWATDMLVDIAEMFEEVAAELEELFP